MNENRLVDIETKLAYQEHTINQFNKVVYRQQQQIDQLEVICKHLLERLKELSGSSGGSNMTDEKPPHY